MERGECQHSIFRIVDGIVKKSIEEKNAVNYPISSVLMIYGWDDFIFDVQRLHKRKKLLHPPKACYYASKRSFRVIDASHTFRVTSNIHLMWLFNVLFMQ